MKKILLLFVIFWTTATACGPVTPFVPTLPTPTYEEVFVDCGWYGTAFVWIDQNEDGEYQDGEQPVPGVPVLVDDTLNGYTDVGGKART
ncbi:MAG: hypothetical protein AB1750_11105, partial [Chloroflexota bacterium]